MTPPDAAALLAGLAPVMAAAPEGPVGVAVSGGGDSTALLLLVQRWAAGAGRRVAAITVDHGLRAESAGEAAAVAALCAARSIPHETRRWADGEAVGNLQARARLARRRLIGAWARERGIGCVALGHTLEDQAETFLMRLARGSGVDGLAAMAPVSRGEGVLWLRPLLGARRDGLRAWLRSEGVGWAEDPGNADPAFDRIRARRALGPLAELGLDPERLAATAGRMGEARAALERATAELARGCTVPGRAGDVVLDPGLLGRAPRELQLRLLAGALCWVSGAVYRPRLAALRATLDAVAAGRLGQGVTLHGCVLRPTGAGVTGAGLAIRREPARVAPPVPLARGAIWDARWELSGNPPKPAGITIGALGAAGLARVPDWRESGLARESLLTTPALWRDGALIAAPLLRPAPGFGFARVSALPAPWELA